MLTQAQITENKEAFVALFKQNIHREGGERLLHFLELSDFFTAPCSTKFHLNYRGGLCEHSLNVYTELMSLCASHDIDTVKNIETLTIISLLHDICKAQFYKSVIKPVKTSVGWVEQQAYDIDDMLPLGHGEKSVIVIMRHMSLTVEEMLAIRWHMGAFDSAFKGGELAFNTAMDRYPVITLLQCADMIASRIIEK